MGLVASLQKMMDNTAFRRYLNNMTPCSLTLSTRAASLRKIVSGGQTGVDRAALDVAMELSIESGGWCPKGRKAEDGKIDNKYPLQETPSDDYAQRTEWNVRDSDGTLILAFHEISGGTQFTVEMAHKYKKPCLVQDLQDSGPDPDAFWKWLEENRICTLNIAGPRQSHDPGKVYKTAREAIMRLLTDACVPINASR